MPIYIKDGTYKPAVKIWQKVGGAWVETPQWWIRHGGSYKLIHTTRNPFYFNVTLPNTVNFNLRDACIAAGWNQTDYVKAQVTVPAGVTVTASSVGIYAFSTGINFPADSSCTLFLQGTISGRGGDGGGSTQAAQAGGPAIFASIPLELLGEGVLQAGGGGGGAGGSVVARLSTFPPTASEARAGGSGGLGGAVGGVGGAGTSTYVDNLGFWQLYRGTGAPGGLGGLTSANVLTQMVGGIGGVGGVGEAGSAGTTAYTYFQPGGGVSYYALTPPTEGAPGGSAYSGTVDTASFTGTILGYRG